MILNWNKRFIQVLAICLILVISLIFSVQFLLLSEHDEQEEPSSVSLLFLGDFMIGDSYHGSPNVPFQQIDSLFENKDDIIINLETAVTNQENEALDDKTYVYTIDPKVLTELTTRNISMVNLANNHAMDYGKKGFEDTLSYLTINNITFFGAGKSLAQARNGIIKTYHSQTTIGYLGYFDYRRSYDEKYHFYATNDKPGVVPMNKSIMQPDIAWMKNKTDLLIVSLHIGDNYETEISRSHQQIARFCIDCGADAVICHSAHIVLPMEIYHQKPIFYSIGNFIFTTPGRFRYVDDIYHVGLGVNLIIQNQRITTIDLIPFKTNNKETEYKPCFLDQNQMTPLFNLIIPAEVNATLYESSARIHCLSKT